MHLQITCGKHGKAATGVKRERSSSIQIQFENRKKRGPTKPIPEADIRRGQTRHMPVVMATRQNANGLHAKDKQFLRVQNVMFLCP